MRRFVSAARCSLSGDGFDGRPIEGDEFLIAVGRRLVLGGGAAALWMTNSIDDVEVEDSERDCVTGMGYGEGGNGGRQERWCLLELQGMRGDSNQRDEVEAVL